ncbi:MAG: hypothetical protein JWN92_1229 [Candidatus Acidoferrum typicum]|nr:hypothetical protein [Candidatus Acidoferrum typicum]
MDIPGEGLLVRIEYKWILDVQEQAGIPIGRILSSCIFACGEATRLGSF